MDLNHAVGLKCPCGGWGAGLLHELGRVKDTLTHCFIASTRLWASSPDGKIMGLRDRSSSKEPMNPFLI